MKKSILILVCFSVIGISKSYSMPIDKSLIDSVSIDSLINTVKDLSGEQKVNKYGINTIISKRQFNSTGNRLAENYLFAKGSELGYNTSKQNCQETCNNIIWESEGTLYPDSVVIIGAHFDSYNLDDPDGYLNLLSPGADDNASGCAAIIEIARLLRNYKPLYKLKFIFWDEEERGLFGSNYYTDLANANKEKIKLYINLDMIGWDNDNDGKMRIRFVDVNKSRYYANQAIRLLQDYNLPLQSVYENGELKDMYSDVYNFWYQGYSAIYLTNMHDYDSFAHTESDLVMYFNNDYFLNMSKLALALVMNNAYDVETDVIKNPVKEKLSIYPNPASDYLVVSGFEREAEIINTLGICFWKGFISNGQRIEVSCLPAGIYFLKTGNIVVKFIKL